MELDSDLTNELKTVRIKRYNVVQSSLTYATITAFLVFCLFVLMFLITLVAGSSMSGMFGGAKMLGAGVGGVLMLIIGPIIYFVLTFLMSLLGFSIYNLVAKWTGGIEVSLQ